MVDYQQRTNAFDDYSLQKYKLSDDSSVSKVRISSSLTPIGTNVQSSVRSSGLTQQQLTNASKPLQSTQALAKLLSGGTSQNNEIKTAISSYIPKSYEQTSDYSSYTKPVTLGTTAGMNIASYGNGNQYNSVQSGLSSVYEYKNDFKVNPVSNDKTYGTYQASGLNGLDNKFDSKYNSILNGSSSYGTSCKFELNFI